MMEDIRHVSRNHNNTRILFCHFHRLAAVGAKNQRDNVSADKNIGGIEEGENMKIIGLIPARKDSKRVPGKNMALLNGKPLLQYAIEGAKESMMFDDLIVSTDCPQSVKLAIEIGAWAISRPESISGDSSHDYEWVKHALDMLPGFDVFVILRPTSPFRTAATIKRALREFLDAPRCDSMRAVEKTAAHPGKSWEIMESGRMYSYDDELIGGFPTYDLPTQSLADVYCQNGCIHIAWTATLETFGNVSGDVIRPFFTEGNEGIDINTPEDLAYAEWLMRGKP